jgi:hypothetical protein
MQIKLKNTPEQVELIKAMGSKNASVAREATEAIAAFLAPVIKKVLLTAGTASTVYRDVEFDEDSDPSIPLDLFYNEGAGYVTVWSQTQAGGLPTSQVEGMKEVKFGTYRLDSAVSFNKKYARKSRLDVVSKAIERMVNEVLTKQEKNGWAVILKALAEAYTPVYAGGQVAQTTYGHTINSAAKGTFTLADLNNLIVRIKRINESYSGNTPIQPYSHGITDLYVSPEVKANIRAFAYNPIATNQVVSASATIPQVDAGWAATQFLSDNLRDEVFRQAGLQSIYGVNIVELIELGLSQKYNSLFNIFTNSTNGNSAGYLGDGSSTQYAPIQTTATWVSGGSACQICVGIDNTRGAYVRPVSVQAESGGTFSVLPDGQFDMYGSRVQKVGFYGFLEEGRVCLDARSTVGIVISN